MSRLDGADGDPAPSAGALELLRRVTEALPPGEAGSLRDLLHADVVSDVQRLAVRGTGTRDEVDAEIVGELLAGVYARTLALVAEARAEVPRG
ncbi:hypothetical protein ACT17Q_05470 [Cellulomonas sp. CW35]|uniref:hypothetical protein n=1 Tax=Cellulomonas sp. CW35 TaxID=3458249 RepID=UPI0040335C3C